jgi:hypothetical protein
VVLHCHDEVTVEIPIRSLTEHAFLEILLVLPPWAYGLPLAGKVHSGPHYLTPPESPALPLAADTAVVEKAMDEFIETGRAEVDTGPSEDPTEADFYRRSVPAEADADVEIAPLTELVSLPMTNGKVCCPFHDDLNPSCSIYPDHYHCHGCGAHGSRLDWLTQVEGMTEAEAAVYMADWSPPAPSPMTAPDIQDDAAYLEGIWSAARSLSGSTAERYLDQTRGIDLGKLPADTHASLRFHPNCIFGPGSYQPCLLALMRDVLGDAVVGIQRIGLVTRNGRIEKLERRMLGRAGVVKLWPASDRLVVGEGLETVLAAATRMTYAGATLTPAWATLSTSKLRTLPPIVGIKRLIILVDHDCNGEGQAAAAICADQWSRAGCEVERLTPALCLAPISTIWSWRTRDEQKTDHHRTGHAAEPRQRHHHRRLRRLSTDRCLHLYALPRTMARS